MLLCPEIKLFCSCYTDLPFLPLLLDLQSFRYGTGESTT